MARVIFVKGLAAVTLLFMVCAAGAVENISLQALFTDKALMLIDGQRRVLTAGETSPEGVKLISADPRAETAVIEVGGKPQTLQLGVVIASFTSAGKGSVTLYPGNGGHFFADGTINGMPVRFLVDTGATTVAMNAATARHIGIDYRGTGTRGYGSTAGGVVRAYSLKLDKVQVGDIVEYDVDASVIEGAGPGEVLLGMSFLGRCDMTRDGEKLQLTQRY